MFFTAAAIFVLVGIAQGLSGNNQGSVLGLAIAIFWFIFGLNIKRKPVSTK